MPEMVFVLGVENQYCSICNDGGVSHGLVGRVHFFTEGETEISYQVDPVEITDTAVLMQYEGESLPMSQPCST